LLRRFTSEEPAWQRADSPPVRQCQETEIKAMLSGGSARAVRYGWLTVVPATC
jgi:hypothetical protein